MTSTHASKIIASTRDLSDFHGGIHPQEMKSLSNQTAISKAALPPKLILPLQQHIGNASKVMVDIGQQVLKGQLLAEADGFVSVNLHAPTSGTIESISEQAIAHPSGQSDLCLTLIPDGQDQWCALSPSEDVTQLSNSEIQAKVRQAGIAGMGGAGFPTDIKLQPPKHANIEILILNAAECEPYITSDDRLLRERADEVVAGLNIVASVLQTTTCLIGIEDNKPEAIAALKAATQDSNIEICVIPTKYPSGGEKQLIKILTGKEVPSGKLPADIGIVCQNVGTVAAIYRAVRFGEPLISRITTLTGLQVQQRGNVEVLLGTPINWLLSQYGYQAAKRERLIMGGPMMGFTLTDTEIPVVKTTNCILAPNEKELPLAPPAQACIRCGLCADACPAELLPQQLYWFARGQEYEKAEHHNLFDCIECGACSFVCPSSIPLVQYYRHAKGEIKHQRADQQKSDQARVRFEARQQRLENEQAEKAAKRKARAEAAAKAQAAKKLAESQTTVIDSAKPEATQAAPIQADLKSQTEPTIDVVDLSELKTAWDEAQSKLDKMYDALDAAKENNPEQITKLSRAVEKNQMRVNQTKQAWQKASTKAGSETKTAIVTQTENETKAESQNASEETNKPDLAALETAYEKADSKLAKLENALANAKPEQVEKLTRAVDKNKDRVATAKAEFEAAQQALNQTDKADAPVLEAPVDIPALELAFEKADSKLAKLENALANAKPEQVEKLTRAVDKNKDRVASAKAELEAAQQALSQTDKADAPVLEAQIDIPALELAFEKADSKLAKLENALANAKPEQVEKLTRAVSKNQDRVKAAQDELEQARLNVAAATTTPVNESGTQ